MKYHVFCYKFSFRYKLYIFLLNNIKFIQALSIQKRELLHQNENSAQPLPYLKRTCFTLFLPNKLYNVEILLFCVIWFSSI